MTSNVHLSERPSLSLHCHIADVAMKESVTLIIVWRLLAMTAKCAVKSCCETVPRCALQIAVNRLLFNVRAHNEYNYQRENCTADHGRI